MTARKPVAPFYAVAVIWLAYAALFPLYKPAHYAIVGAASAVVFLLVALLCRNTAQAPAAASGTEKKKEEKPTGNPELDKMIKDGKLAVAEMKRLDDNIEDPAISADIVRLEEISEKIFDRVREDPSKLPQIRKFMDYYLPTTLKLLNAYDRASAAGISGENINSTMKRVAGMMNTVVTAFEKQLDALFGSEALDISTDITVLENMMAREGLAGEQLHAKTSPGDDGDIKLEL
jgi:hypothetical protein